MPDQPDHALSASVRELHPGGDGGRLRGDQPGPLLLAHSAPDPVGLTDRQCVLETGVEHRAPGAHGLGRGLPTGPSRTAFAVRVEEEGRVLATACAVELPVPDLGNGCREPANVGHLSSRARREPEGAVRLLQAPGAPALTWSNTSSSQLFASSCEIALLTPGGEGGCCSPIVSIKLETGRCGTGRGRNPDPRRDRCRGAGSPWREPPPLHRRPGVPRSVGTWWLARRGERGAGRDRRQDA